MATKHLPTRNPIKAPLNPERYANATTMAFFTADVSHLLMAEATNLLLRDNKDLRHDTRRRYNNFLDAMDRARKAAAEVGRDVMGLSDQQVDYFFDDVEYVKEAMILIYEKTKHGNNATEIIKYLKSL